MRVLVIEDEVRIVEILQEALSRAGFVVDSVRRCTEAREALSLTAYDAAVLDLVLPDGDGLTLLADLQSSHNRVPVLVLTARDAVQDRVSGLDAGADDYLVKPSYCLTGECSRDSKRCLTNSVPIASRSSGRAAAPFPDF